MIFVHGFGGNRYTSWGKFPTFLFDDFPDQAPYALDLGFYEYRTGSRGAEATGAVNLSDG